MSVIPDRIGNPILLDGQLVAHAESVGADLCVCPFVVTHKLPACDFSPGWGDKEIGVAQTNAVGMFTQLADRFPALRQVDVEHWDFILTIAGVFMAATRLTNLRLGDNREERLMEVVAAKLDQWKPDGINGFEDCKGMFESEYDRLIKAGHELPFVASDAVGQWIVLNVLKRPPHTHEECMMVRATGGMATHVFFDWWDK